MTSKEFEMFKAMFSNLEARMNRIENKVDSLGKVVQTDEGTGTWTDPFKNWQVGQSVEAGKWYNTSDGYLWEAIKSGVPSSTTDREYFDVVGV